MLADLQIVSDSRIFRAALWWTGQGRGLKAGEYRFDRPLTTLDVIDVLVRGDVYLRRITFPEGLTIEEMAKLYESREFGAARDFLAAAKNAQRIHDLDPEAKDLEGYLFPETYLLPRGAPASSLVEAMVDRFRAVYGEEMRARAAAQGLTTRQVVTLASLVEKETGKADERPIVAGVYRNRMKIGMPMQADPTVVYALEKAHRYDGNIRRDDLGLDSPYNTYKYPGAAAGADCLARQGVARGGAHSRRRAVSLFRQQERRLTRVRDDACGARQERPDVSDRFLPSAEAGGTVAGRRGSAALALAPLQFFAQQLEVASRRRLHEPQHALGFLHADDVALVNGVAVLAVVGHEHVF